MPKILLLTTENPSHDDYETALVAKALTELQVESDIVPRTSPSLGLADLAVYSTTWDHTQQLEDFLSVLGGMESRLSNPLEESAVDLGDPRRRTAPAPLPATTRIGRTVQSARTQAWAVPAKPDRTTARTTVLIIDHDHVKWQWRPHCSQATVTNLVKLSLLVGTGHRHGPPEGLGPNVNAPNYLALPLPCVGVISCSEGVGR